MNHEFIAEPIFLVDEKTPPRRISISEAQTILGKDPFEIAKKTQNRWLPISEKKYIIVRWPRPNERKPGGIYQSFIVDGGGGGITGGAADACHNNKVSNHDLSQRFYDADWGDVSDLLWDLNDKKIFKPTATLHGCYILPDGQKIGITQEKRLSHGHTVWLIGKEDLNPVWIKGIVEQAKYAKTYEWKPEWDKK